MMDSRLQVDHLDWASNDRSGLFRLELQLRYAFDELQQKCEYSNGNNLKCNALVRSYEFDVCLTHLSFLFRFIFVTADRIVCNVERMVFGRYLLLIATFHDEGICLSANNIDFGNK